MNDIKSDYVVDAKDLACPMPIVRTKKAMKDLEPGKVMEVQATDKGSTADLAAWAKSTGHDYLGTVEEGDVLKHYLRKVSGEEKAKKKHPHVINNEELQNKLNENIVVLDVREEAEFAFNHISNAKSVPLGELENRLNELHKEDEIYVVCKTGNRSDLAAQTLTEAGFKNVVNVVPGMSEWKGETEKN
ncbi:sulfurtransferase TusA family protein [Bacillus taeanensis]|uniref:Rhodanese domain-containing protein n=1 Tax=Bacillus taeanensis TaxID=273032 RepID=A0A366XXG5_9BACI|nr:sulfurtransferase TusA family protein [Bacillus taeanensis]RBW68641.1 hypothetical protein DS031_15940 [Bacillus taeanensis]